VLYQLFRSDQVTASDGTQGVSWQPEKKRFTLRLWRAIEESVLAQLMLSPALLSQVSYYHDDYSIRSQQLCSLAEGVFDHRVNLG